MLKSMYLLYRTFYYLFISYFTKASLQSLKKKWAEEILAFFEIELVVQGEPPKINPTILLGNHISYIDIIALMAAHPGVVFLAKKEIQKWPIIGSTAARVGTLFVDRDSRQDKQLMRKKISVELSEKKSQLVVFPSGTTTLNEEAKWKKGMFEVAKEFSLSVFLFKVSYSHPRICAYIDEDTMLGQMQRMRGISGKKVYVSWLGVFESLAEPEVAADLARLKVVHTSVI